MFKEMKSKALKLFIINICLSVIVCNSLWADGEILRLPIQEETLAIADLKGKIDRLIQSPKGVLERFTPKNLDYKNKLVENNKVTMDVTKKILGFKKTVKYVGTLTVTHLDNRKAGFDECYAVLEDFFGSGALLTDHVSEFSMEICLKKTSEPFAEKENYLVRFSPSVKKADSYGGIVGPIVIDIIKDQVDPIIQAIRQEIESFE